MSCKYEKHGFHENEKRRKELFEEKHDLFKRGLLGKRGITPKIEENRRVWRNKHPEQEPPWIKFSMG